MIFGPHISQVVPVIFNMCLHSPHFSNVPSTLPTFFSYVSTQFGRSIQALQTGNGKEFYNLIIHTLLASHGTIYLPAHCPYTSPKMTMPNVCSTPLVTASALSYFMAMFHLAFGLMHSPRQLFSLTFDFAMFYGTIHHIIFSSGHHHLTIIS